MKELRITTGIYKGRKIATPGEKTHPMGERERIALFNMITGDVAGARILDAYAGSGALGIEALSRGASEVEFLEKSPAAVKTIRENLRKLDLRARLVTGEAENFTTDDGFDLILADPPYDDFDLPGLEYLAGFLKNGGVLVLSHPDEAPSLPEMKLIKSRKYAAAHLSVYVKR
ncbi:RsmD family RNA methyltransferase [Candidatus Saccharibacteria bacterium]|nr:RsmD family RNA methyltransferase [Candidatus Saccharibacteria bacterium]